MSEIKRQRSKDSLREDSTIKTNALFSRQWDVGYSAITSPHEPVDDVVTLEEEQNSLCVLFELG